MAVDNLPSELPRDSSKEFGDGIVNEVIPYILNEDDGRILNATITQNGSFLEKYNYLHDYINTMNEIQIKQNNSLDITKPFKVVSDFNQVVINRKQ